MLVRLAPPSTTSPSSEVVVSALVTADKLDPLPWLEAESADYFIGSRRVIAVDDGWLVAYSPLYGLRGYVFGASADGRKRRSLSGVRIAGFARSPTGMILALAIGRARMGRGGVIAFDRSARGDADDVPDLTPRLVVPLPVEPSPVAFDDGGVIVGFAEGFVFRVDERGRVENVHYIGRDIGRVTSIVKTVTGNYYLGLECGVLRLTPESDGTYREEWWSVRTGDSGRWTSCEMDL